MKRQALATVRPPRGSIAYRCFLPSPSFLHLEPDLDQAADPLRFCKLTTNEDAGALGTDRLVMWVFLVDSEDFPGSVYRSLIVLRDDKGAGENEATN